MIYADGDEEDDSELNDGRLTTDAVDSNGFVVRCRH